MHFDRSSLNTLSEEVSLQERGTTGEIKVVIHRHCWRPIRAKAAKVFREAGLDQTAERNAVMIFIVTSNRECLIYGDVGVHHKVGQGYWNSIRDDMVSSFQAGEMTEGVRQAVQQVGATLRDLYPSGGGDENELSDEVLVADA